MEILTLENLIEKIDKNKSLELKDVIQKLQDFTEDINPEESITCIKDIIHCLEQGNMDGAKTICGWEYNKISAYPEIEALLKSSLFADQENHPWSALKNTENNVSKR
ncbi:hypothetical protein A2331_06175 [Candidatus Falkowbacteria bacterium RIFOXYB2_FULL_34_18]|uniref:Uncharacterized protein n=1 Tax=Candidatus Falkowbacteria bacterium RIFOXYD2_FULL_34_120 TaxID=1798007 RepID=A0A1F5TNS9_9BACT|nr:MAG: hypothetical protein A2331_06175 [Candidatus Falkowbacteria bacterium RIFOXYB2_FULL_34_18]OGF28779.1 MAG: hypothetical protein A2500_04525 [Candidatus Falkowbacteria bacterium RIFOXYC12_FULL_34_55]OGF35694.1 MAG: hypothetical protein A2466_05040 [Candidatus Falkowbacteria bacterium RIFOXYC2_FULL_34_220]OGF38409.1 MAG: hypothetical protein A2515_00530 [Candidatus Falkowbacteria bacterium RIFOXYD12_FULL_34_57]OGF40464.1 MAG: hypothetical protein A2531_03010 [Candidatus Falkowbacteria bact